MTRYTYGPVESGLDLIAPEVVDESDATTYFIYVPAHGDEDVHFIPTTGGPKMQKIKVSPARRRNLALLASYLEYLPEDYQHFEMESYINDPKLFARDSHASLIDVELVYAKQPDRIFHCGTVACALGHAPAAGITVPPRFLTEWNGINWDMYGQEKFADNSDLYEFLFGGHWTVCDNHHWGAAARIRYFLAGEDISKADEKPAVYAMYRVTEPGPLPEGAFPFHETCCKVPA